MGGFVQKITRKEPPKQAQEVQREAVKEEPKGPTAAELEPYRLLTYKTVRELE